MHTALSSEFGPIAVTVKVGEHKVGARIGGAGAPIILFHSLLADSSSFDPLARLLAATNRVVVLDLPGFGHSDRVDGGLEAVADRLAAAIREFNYTQAPIFLGNGYGGFVALLTAIRHPDLAGKLVLADCGAAFSDAGRAAFKGMSAGAAANGLTAIADVAMRRLFSLDFQAANPALVAQRRERFLAVDPQTFHDACAALSTLDLRADLAVVTVPTLVLVGEHDEATPPPMSVELAAGLPNATLTILPGCAHVPQLQQPEQFMAAIAAFIAQS
ncbi:alpha/beta fold hydrolase [Actimicrobium antarcticum]|uniref:Alpha/beta fold hydrolase n=1 Tax=Actimicrobium antarcticum TaxID=1051899 RepID=A0ABP7SNJ0_9BURK